MKLKIAQILPLLLAISLPGLGFFLAEENTIQNIPFPLEWAFTSLVLYSIWWVLYYSWNFKPYHRQFLFILGSMSLFLLLLTWISFGIGIITEADIEAKQIIRIVFLVLIFLTIQHGLKSQKRIESLKVEKEQISKENYKAQLQILRNQMDPHFLFNSLNTLRSLLKNNDAAEFVLNLSNFYRSTLQHNKSSTLTLSEELSFLKSYLLLMKRRNEEAIIFDISEIDRKYDSYRLPIFALQGVVENCFKHNSMSSKQPLIITIKSNEVGLIEVKNNLQERLTPQTTTGMGLTLLRRRYQLLGVKEGVIISQTNKFFNVQLKLINPI